MQTELLKTWDAMVAAFDRLGAGDETAADLYANCTAELIVRHGVLSGMAVAGGY